MILIIVLVMVVSNATVVTICLEHPATNALSTARHVTAPRCAQSVEKDGMERPVKANVGLNVHTVRVTPNVTVAFLDDTALSVSFTAHWVA